MRRSLAATARTLIAAPAPSLSMLAAAQHPVPAAEVATRVRCSPFGPISEIPPLIERCSWSFRLLAVVGVGLKLFHRG